MSDCLILDYYISNTVVVPVCYWDRFEWILESEEVVLFKLEE